MKIKITILAMIATFVCLSLTCAQEYGRVRALKDRAAHVVRMKNDFVTRVLNAYAIPYERNLDGTVVRIKTEGRWHQVGAIEIVPVLARDKEDRFRVTAHEIFFYTPEGILDLVSELTVR